MEFKSIKRLNHTIGHFCILGTKDMNCLQLQLVEMSKPFVLGFSHGLKIKAWAEAHQEWQSLSTS
jgi:hypothetical protein